MRDREPDLNAAEARLAELHLRQRLGEALNDAERAELAAAPSSFLKVREELDRTHTALNVVAAKVGPRAGFAKKVMAKLPAPVEAVPAGAIFVARSRPWARVWLSAGIAAAVAAAVTVAMLWSKTQSAEMAKDAPAKVLRGDLTDAEGHAVKEIAAGQTYRTGSNDVVLQVSDQSLLRITPNTEFQALPAEGKEIRHGLHLRKGSLYAKDSGSQPVLVRAPDFDTEVEDGVAWVMQDAAEDVVAAQSVVLVFKGKAHVHVADEVLTVGEGELYVAGETVEPLHVFLENAPQRVNETDTVPESMQKRRKRYREVIEGYRADLRQLDSEIAATTEPVRLAEIQTRRERVHALLQEHRKKLDTMSAGDEERPVKERSLRRTLEKVREGQHGYTDPATWM